MRNYSSSPTSLSSPPSALSEPGSPTRLLSQGRANIEMDEIVVDPGSANRFGVTTQQRPPAPPGVQLTAAGLPRKKPGRKPGSTVKPKAATDTSSTNTEPKQRRPRKPRDPNAPPIQRKRKAAAIAAENAEEPMQIDSDSRTGPVQSRQPRITELTSMRMALDEPTAAQNPPKREAPPKSMMSILNDEPAPRPQPPAPVTTTTRQIFDPVRGNYDPVRETMVARDPYGTGVLGSPRAPSQVVNRASASPSIASLVDPPSTNTMSPGPSHQPYGNSAAGPSRFHESTSLPPSPPHPSRSNTQAPAKPPTTDIKRPPPPPPASAQTKPEPPKNTFTSMTSIPSAVTLAANAAPTPAQSKKVAAVAQQDREKHQKSSTASSSPNSSGPKDTLPAVSSGSGRSILDFGKANPGEELQAPSIVLHIPLNGETNKYVNFMRMAEERYGWDALHPRLAAHRERKARIAAASAALEKNGSGRESGDEMSVDLQSDGEGSNAEMGGMGNGAGGTSGPDGAPAKPARKKRNFKEDEYDKADDFVDDSELLWEQQAAASRDGFFVYSGPLIPEVEKPVAGYVYFPLTCFLFCFTSGTRRILTLLQQRGSTKTWPGRTRKSWRCERWRHSSRRGYGSRPRWRSGIPRRRCRSQAPYHKAREGAARSRESRTGEARANSLQVWRWFRDTRLASGRCQCWSKQCRRGRWLIGAVHLSPNHPLATT